MYVTKITENFKVTNMLHRIDKKINIADKLKAFSLEIFPLGIGLNFLVGWNLSISASLTSLSMYIPLAERLNKQNPVKTTKNLSIDQSNEKNKGAKINKFFTY